ncbi:MAG: hypothetical protein ACYDD1_03710 [Caulobacteraceae bacterium]
MTFSLSRSEAKLTRHSRVKLRCINLNDDQNYWDSFWGVNWSEAKVALMLRQAVSCGFNCVKVYFDGVTSGPYGGNGYLYGAGYPAWSVLALRAAWFVQQCRSLGLRIYLSMNQAVDFVGSTTAITVANITGQMAYLKFFRNLAADILVAVDLCNEMNSGIRDNVWKVSPHFGTATPTAAMVDMTSLTRAARATVPDIPLTASVYIGSAKGVKASYVENEWLDLQYTLGLDFHDYHPYYDFDDDGLKPTADDVVKLESRAKFIGRHMIGECGCARDTVDRLPTVSELAWLKGMGDHCASRNSFGANYFSISGYYEGTVQARSVYGPPDGYGFGLLDANLENPRRNIVDAVSRWPART